MTDVLIPERLQEDVGTQIKWVSAVAFAMFVLFLATGHYNDFYGSDPFTNAAQARAFADDQHPILEELEGFADPRYQGRVAWFEQSVNGTTSKYPPGTAVWAAPFYLVDHSYGDFDYTLSSGEEITLAYPNTLVPATVAATLSVALAAWFFGLTLLGLMPQRDVLLAMLIGGLGTSAWSLAADRLWQHGPAMMCISAGTYFASRDRFGVSGLAFAAAVLVRPHTAVIAACIGLAVAISRRSVRELVLMGAATAVGLVALMYYNNLVYDSYSISGGYSGGFADRLASASLYTVGERFVLSLVHVRVGVLWTSPFVGFALVAMVRRYRSSPDWAIGGAIGAFCYLAIQYRANRVTGGSGFFSYRYPLEALMAGGPMLAYSTWLWLKGGERRKVGFALAAVFAVLAHGAGAILS